MKKEMTMIANGNFTDAVKEYKNTLASCEWMDEVREDDIYAEIASAEHKLFLALCGIEEAGADAVA